MTDLYVKSLQPVYYHCRSCLPQFALAIREAADRIEELEITLKNQQHTCRTLAAENERLRAALEQLRMAESEAVRNHVRQALQETDDD